MDVAKSQFGSLRMPNGLKVAREQVKAWLSPLSETSPLMALASTANELYEQVRVFVFCLFLFFVLFFVCFVFSIFYRKDLA